MFTLCCTVSMLCRFVEDNWESPVLGAWGLGWEVWLDGMEVTQFTYFQQVRQHGTLKNWDWKRGWPCNGNLCWSSWLPLDAVRMVGSGLTNRQWRACLQLIRFRPEAESIAGCAEASTLEFAYGSDVCCCCVCQAGGKVLDAPAVEITYGLERILMSLQGVKHFKDIR